MNSELDALLNDDLPKKKEPLFLLEYCEPYEYHPYMAPMLDDEGQPIFNDDGTQKMYEPKWMWSDTKGKKHLNYPAFVENFALANNLVSYHGLFYTPDGVMSESEIRRSIAYSLSDAGWQDRMDNQVNSLFNTLKDMKSVDEMTANGSVIPFANGDLHISTKEPWVFRFEEKKQMPYRLGVDLVLEDAPMPKFEKWLKDLFDPDDVTTIQEMLGYCMLPLTNVQEAFFLVGDASAGKSVIGHILGKIFHNGFQAITTNDLVTKRFQIASAENKLVLYDDDLGSAALEETGLLKKLITADQEIPAERKYEKGFTFVSYAKVVACANFMLSSLYDDSNGFYRRLHPIQVLPRDPNRKTISGFVNQIAEEESEQIVRWALKGLKRLMNNNWQIHWSDRSREYMGQVREQGNHYPEFLNETLEICEDQSQDVSSSELRMLYEKWCKANSIQDTRVKRMFNWLSDNSDKYGLMKSRNVIREGKQVRGYKGVSIRNEWKNVGIRL